MPAKQFARRHYEARDLRGKTQCHQQSELPQACSCLYSVLLQSSAHMRALLTFAPRLARRFVAPSGGIVPLINHMGVSRPNRSALHASGSVNTGMGRGRMYVPPTSTVLSHCGAKASFALQDFGALRARACRYNDVTDEERLCVCPARP